ncbi:MAG: LptF/LptG family permease [Opitutaceae bacterium]|jgi:lipopolysaccharide export system permease protein|nr:LptF/LptG family permease [Opitutaceae bacterium]
MPVTDRHVLGEWLKTLGIVLLVMMGLLLIQALYDDFRDMLANDAGAADLFVYYVIKTPGYLSVVLPVALLVSLLYALGLLHRNNEITAMRAAGMSVFRITRPIWAAGVLLCGITWFVNAHVIPWSIEESRDIRARMEFQRQRKAAADDRVGVRTGVAFDNHRQRRLWYFNRYSQFTQRGYGVTVVELDARRREKTRILAREAFYDRVLRQWVFRDGRELWVDPATNVVTRTEPFQSRPARDYTEDPALMLAFDVKPNDLSFDELRRIVGHFTVEENPRIARYAVRYYGMLAETLGPLIIIALAIPFSISGVRVNPAVGVSKSIGLFLLYYALVRTFTALGTRGVLPPEWAAAAPNAAMLLVGLWFFRRMR